MIELRSKCRQTQRTETVRTGARSENILAVRCKERNVIVVKRFRNKRNGNGYSVWSIFKRT